MTDDSSEHEALAIEYPAFNPTVVPAQVDENTIHVRAGPWSGPIITVRDTDEDAAITRLVDRIDGETHVEELIEVFDEDAREEVLDALAQLAANDVVHDAGAVDDELHPHLAMRHQFRQLERDRVDAKTVAVVGDAGMARHVVEDLLELGVGEVGVVPVADPGDAFARVAGEERFESFPREDLREVVTAADLVVYTGERPRPMLLSDLNGIAHETDTPWVLGQVLGFDGIVGPAVFPGETACYECFERRTLANVSNREGYVGYRDAMAADDHLATQSLPMFRRAVAGYLALDVLHLLAFGVGFTAGSVVTMNSLDCSVANEDVLKLPRCPTCGVDSGHGNAQFVGLEDVVHADRIGGGD
ncbi:TOMM precursor leader peptide-binding protein [Haloarchaeobius baliensis]|uniref:TOMM precursor leader peptide-binding protein n=1 Tax=Haloarchaeobius baliensis TaxID=1670458 RepID=UPI003F88419A